MTKTAKLPSELGRYKANIWKMYLYKFLLSLHFVGGVLVPFYLEWGKISFPQIMFLQSFFVFSAFLLEIPSGAVADFLGRKVSIIMAALSMMLAAGIYSSTPVYAIFFVAEFCWALGFALLSGADEALVYDSLKHLGRTKDSKKIFARFTSFEIFALMISAPIGSIIASMAGVRITMMMMTVPFFVAAIVGFSFKEPKTEKKVESTRYLKILVDGVKYFKGHTVLKILAFDRISIAVLSFFIIWTYQPLLTAMSIPIIYFGFVQAAINGIQIPFMNNFDVLERWFGSKKNYLLWSAIITGIAFILIGLFTYLPLTIFLLIIIAGFGLSRYVLFQNYMNKYIESHNRATVISTVSMIEQFARAILYLGMGFLVEWSLTGALIIVGILIIVSTFFSQVEEKHLID